MYKYDTNSNETKYTNKNETYIYCLHLENNKNKFFFK